MQKRQIDEKNTIHLNPSKHRHGPSTCICDFFTEFEKHCSKTKSYGTTWSDDLLAYHILKSAIFTIHDKQLAKAIIGEFSYDAVQLKLSKILSDTSKAPTFDFNSRL